MLAYSPVVVVPSELNSPALAMVRRIAKAFHEKEIRLTWGILSTVIDEIALDLSGWLGKHGDGFLLMLDWNDLLNDDVDPLDSRAVAEESVRRREVIPKYILSEMEKVKSRMPQLDISVVGSFVKPPELLYSMRECGLKGLWGYDWLNEPDMKAPFGVFVISDDSPCATYPVTESSIVGLPRSSMQTIDLVGRKVWTDPLSECIWALDQHARCSQWNERMIFIHELDVEEYDEIVREYPEDLDRFLNRLIEMGLKFMPITRFVEEFSGEFRRTPSSFLLVDRENEQRKVLFYHDGKSRMTFEEGEVTPVDLRDYTLAYGRLNSDFAPSEKPSLERLSTGRERDKLIIIVEIESTKETPYALALWGDFVGLSVKESSVNRFALLGSELLFLRMDLNPGKNRFRVVMSI